MNRNDAIEALIKQLKNKGYITDLEKDILDTANEINKNPFDRKSAETKIRSNNTKYPDIFVAISSLPTTAVRPFNQVSDDDVKYNLQNQLEMLCVKKLGDSNNGQNEI